MGSLIPSFVLILNLRSYKILPSTSYVLRVVLSVLVQKGSLPQGVLLPAELTDPSPATLIQGGW